MKKNKQNGFVVIVFIVVVLIIILGYVYLQYKDTYVVLDTNINPISTTINLNDPKTTQSVQSITEISQIDRISEILQSVKGEISLPLKLNDNITWQSLEATKDSLLYKYTVKKVEKGTSDATLKHNLIELLCDLPQSKYILDNDINIDYLYSVENTNESFFVSLNKADCK